MSAELDDVDRRILRAVQDKGKLSAQDLADETGHGSPATCWRRLRSLEEAGYIEGYRAAIDRRKLGFHVSAFVYLSIERQHKDIVSKIERKILDRPEVLDCYMTTGDSDFTLRVVARDIDDYERFMQTFLFELPGVSHVRSSIALREVKQTNALPV